MKTLTQYLKIVGMLFTGFCLIGFALEAVFHLAGTLILVAFWGMVVMGIIGIASYAMSAISGDKQNPK